MNQKRKTDADQDQAVEDSFPASDPPSNTPLAGERRSHDHQDAHETGRSGHGDHRTPKGAPTDQRHATETAAARIAGVSPPEADGQ